MVNEPASTKRSKWGWYLLLIIPFVATLWIPFYGSATPYLAGSIPFFYWYMFLWVLISAVITAVVYLVTA
jgi:hypothetical protein